MHVLVTNDDGYFAEGIRTLARVAMEMGHSVIISAPLTEQSATSHQLTLSRALTAHPVFLKARWLMPSTAPPWIVCVWPGT